MIRLKLMNGQELLQAETEQEWLEMQPEAKLRELFRGDVDGMAKFADRLRELEIRFDRWQVGDFWRRYRGRILWAAEVFLRVSARP